MHAPLSGLAVGIKKPEFAFGLFYGGEGGIDSLRSPCGPPLAVQNASVFSNPVEGFDIHILFQCFFDTH
ncbi:hypothetical protein FOT57_05985 [Serratia ureilytica]|nr:hypothetical protein FOT57_05985 [Serratia ureilytica]